MNSLQNGWTPLHCAARAGKFDCVKLLVESGASPKSETNYGSAPIWFAASEGHNDVLEYLLTKEHDSYSLMDDKRVRSSQELDRSALELFWLLGMIDYPRVACVKPVRNLCRMIRAELWP